MKIEARVNPSDGLTLGINERGQVTIGFGNLELVIWPNMAGALQASLAEVLADFHRGAWPSERPITIVREGI